MKILLVHPAFPISFWGFEYSVPIAGKRANLPPLGLISLAALLPRDWEIRLVDLNIHSLSDAEILWADAVLSGGMRVQAPSIHEVVAKARALGRRTVVGGPAPTTTPAEFSDADIVFRGEAEERIESLVSALEAPNVTTRLIAAPAGSSRPEMSSVPVPRFDLLALEHYVSAGVQFSRGCPYSCEFCDIIEIFGRTPRVKSTRQMLAELDALHLAGHRGSLFFVDDNFIGNKPAVKELLPSLSDWQETHGHPFELFTEASVNLASDDVLMRDMVRAGFTTVFVGIETPSTQALAKAGKRQNLRLDLHDAVVRMTASGLEVMGGFIVGFDQDDAQTIELQRRFIDSAPIPLAMVGLLMALPETGLWRRLAHEGRLRHTGSGDQFDRPNFTPAMDEVELLRGYADLLAAIYSPAAFFRRCEKALALLPRVPGRRRPTLEGFKTVFRSIIQLGVKGQQRYHFWRLLAISLLRAPYAFPWAVARAVQSEHMIRYTREHVLPRLERSIAEVIDERQQLAHKRGSSIAKTG